MNWKNLVITTFLGTSMLLVGCGDDDGTTLDTGVDTIADDGGTDTATDTPVSSELIADCADDGECTFAASVISIDNAQGMGASTPVAGDNIDGEVTEASGETGCGKQDYTNKYDSSVAGVDNALAGNYQTLMAATDGQDVNEVLAESVADGTAIILMSFSGVDGANDSDVTLTIYRAANATPTVTGGVIDADQTFDYFPATATVTGSLADGVFSADGASVSVSLSGNTLTIADAAVRVSLTGSVPSMGEIAGAIPISEVLALAPAGTEPIVMGLADLEPDGDGNCQGLSAGINFEGTAAALGVEVAE